MRGAAWVLLALLIPAAAQKDSSQRSIGTIDWGLGASDNTFLASSPAWTARSAHYVASYRPSEEKASADIVALRVLPRRLVKLDDVEQTYTLDAQLQIIWKDARLAYTVTSSDPGFIPPDPDMFNLPMRPDRDIEATGEYTISPTPGNLDPSNRIWTPQMDMSLNMVAEKTMISPPTWALYPSGVVYQQEHAVFQMHQRLNLRMFPFDSHKLVFTLHSSSVNADKVALELYMATTSGSDSWLVEPWIEGFTITDTNHYIGSKPLVEASGSLKSYDVYVMEISLTRDPLYTLCNQAVPLMLIMAMSVTCFLNELNAFDKRVTILITSILTLMAFSVYLGDSLPKTAYMTCMHILVYNCYFMLLAAVFFVSLLWTTLHSICNAADRNSDGNATHEEMLTYLQAVIESKKVQSKLVAAGLANETRSPNAPELAAESSKVQPSEQPAQDGPGQAGELGAKSQQSAVHINLGAVNRLPPIGAMGPPPVEGLEAPSSARTDLNADLDGDGLVSKKERKLFEALDADGDGAISTEELWLHAQSMPLDDWGACHVFVFLLKHSVPQAVCTEVLRQNIDGATIALFDRLAFQELGISSPILIAKLKKSMNEFLLGPSRARQSWQEENGCVRCLSSASYTDGCVNFKLSPEAMMLLVRIDFQMRYWFFIIWIVLAVLVYGGYALFNGDKHYDASELGISFDSDCTNYTQAQYCGTA